MMSSALCRQNQPLRVSIAVCTHNRPRSLRRTLTCLKSLKVRSRFEILVIDNCSSDGTRQVVDQFVGGKPSVRYVYESKLGLANALNRAVEEARGDIIAFMDDDQTVADNWLRAVAEGFKDERTQAILVRRYPLDEKGRLVRDPTLIFPTVDYGDQPILIDPGNYRGFCCPTGASAFRTEALRAMGRFRTDLGVKGKRQFGGEDTDMFERFVQAGERVVYWPQAIVYHHIAEHRRSLGYTIRRHFDRAISEAVMDGVLPCRRVFGVPLFCIRRAMGEMCGLVVQARLGRKHSAGQLMKLAYSLGAVWGHTAVWWRKRSHFKR